NKAHLVIGIYLLINGGSSNFSISNWSNIFSISLMVYFAAISAAIIAPADVPATRWIRYFLSFILFKEPKNAYAFIPPPENTQSIFIIVLPLFNVLTTIAYVNLIIFKNKKTHLLHNSLRCVNLVNDSISLIFFCFIS